uniref:Delta-like protein 1 isoform X2 n=1 Tax=Crassostrea virginica TaxID=6565 RepID=A0A8B8DFM2_CRAVI|nr:delta-like protein 1 isoform X2 [Crassostrea virginica]
MYAVVLLVCCSWVALFCPSVQAYENLALHKTAWQSSTFRSYTGAERAVDGRYTNVSVWGGQCARSAGEQTAEWRVDLRGVKYIHHVFIQYATDSEVWDENNFYTRYFLGFSVYISNTTNKEDGVVCFRDTNYTRATIPNPVNIACPYHGRYVIYYNNRTHPPYPEGYSDNAWNLLCEVEVYGCDAYTYGVDCKRYGNCSGGVQCNKVTGSCQKGCKAGIYGDKCDLECGNNTYGVECKELCGNCSNGEPCHHVDGTCPHGCDAGMYGVTCKESCGNCSNGDTCNDVDGSCPYACDVGVYGKTCDEACQSGRYGISCTKACGQNCRGCNRFNGVCEFGCHPGWTGTFCEKRKF